MRDGEIRSRSDPARPGQTTAATKAAMATSRIPAPAQLMARMRASFVRRAWLQNAFGEMPDRLAAQSVSRLNANRVERPEIRFRDPQQRAPADPAGERDDEQNQRRADPANSSARTKTPPTQAVAMSGARPRMTAGATIDASHASRSFVRLISASRPAGDRQQRLLLRARGVVLDVAVARIEDRPLALGPGRSSLEGETSGPRVGSDEGFPTAFAP